MVSAKRIALASAALSLGATAPSTKRSEIKPFSLQQIPNPNFCQLDGPAAYAKAARKYAATSLVTSTSQHNGSIVASPVGNDQQYLTQISIGGQTITSDLDTGSSDLWVFYNVTENTNHTNYKPGPTAKVVAGQTWQISYGDGNAANGIVYTDTVTLGGIAVTGQAVEAATGVSPGFLQMANDGLVGLAFKSINQVYPTKQNTWMDNAAAQGLPNLFAADLQFGKPGKYDFGAIDPAYSASSIEYLPVNETSGLWEFTPTSYSISGGTSSKTVKISQKLLPAIADTGTTLIMVDPEVVAAYYAQIPNSVNSTVIGGQFLAPCNSTFPSLTIALGSYEATVPGEYINYGPIDDEFPGYCFGGIQSNVGVGGYSIFGDVFLVSQYVVFDRTTSAPRIGFAEKIGGGSGGDTITVISSSSIISSAIQSATTTTSSATHSSIITSSATRSASTTSSATHSTSTTFLTS